MRDIHIPNRKTNLIISIVQRTIERVRSPPTSENTTFTLIVPTHLDVHARNVKRTVAKATVDDVTVLRLPTNAHWRALSRLLGAVGLSAAERPPQRLGGGSGRYGGG